MTTALYTSIGMAAHVVQTDPATNTNTASVSTAPSPYYLGLTPDLSMLIVAVNSGLEVFSLPSLTSLHTASMTGGQPVVAADATAYSVSSAATVRTLQLSAPWTVGTISIPGITQTYNLVMSRDQTKIYVLGFSAQVWVIDVGSNTASALLTLGGYTSSTVGKGLAINPSGTVLYVGVHGGVIPVTLTPFVVQGPLIATAVGSIIDDIQIGQSGNTLWALDSHANTYQPIPTPAGPAGSTTAVTQASQPQSAALTPDEAKLFITDRQTAGHLQILTTASGLITGSISMGNTPLATIIFPTVSVGSTASDPIAFTDAVVRSLALPRTVADNIAFGDDVVRSGAGFGIAMDNIFFVDGVVRTVTPSRSDPIVSIV